MHRVIRVAFPVVLIAGAVHLISQETPGQVDFQTQVQPIFTQRCQGCHGGNSPAANLRLDSAASVSEAVKSGKITPGKPAESLLVQRITDTSGSQMPPTGSPLSAAEISVIRKWIDQGAHLPATPAADLYTSDVEPLLKRECYSCHSGSQPRGGLNLSVKSLALKGGALGNDIVPGKSGESRLIHRVLGDPSGGGPQMPFGGTPLSAKDVATLRHWIDAGAVWPDNVTAQAAAPKHWAYVKPVRPKLPDVKDKAWVRNPIDQFVLARLEKEGLQPSKEASKETLIRRVSLDLTGLPPTPAEVDAFVSDKRSDAYDRLVDRLLASPHYGERWATPWLDLARYGDSEGWTNDRQREAWPYRDWVIRALNNNMPFDEFTIEQLAGDLLPNSTIDQKIATGFVRASMLQSEGGTDPAENNWTAQLDRASTVGTALLGSSIACAQCHDHKYDPFTQKQFYQMVAFFNNSKFVDPADPTVLKVPDARLLSFTEPVLTLPTPEQAKKRDLINAQISEYVKQLNDVSPEFYKRQRDWEARVKAASNDWKNLRPTHVASSGGSTLTLNPDDTILASGKNPSADVYVLEAPAPVNEINGLRIEAIPDLSLPGGGPGRDYYGNFMVHSVTLEAGIPGQKFRKIDLKSATSDIPPPRLINSAGKEKELWMVDATHLTTGKVKKYAEKAAKGELGALAPSARIPMQLVLVPSTPFQLQKGETLRVTIDQTTDVAGVNIGHFRLSVTDSSSPKTIVDVPAALRPILELDPDSRTPEQAEELTAHYRTVAVELAPVRAKIAQLREQIEDLRIPQALILAENTAVKHPSTYVRLRGAFVAKGDLVEADVPSFLGSIPAGAPPNRLGLAKWLVSRDNPLTARVAVNHYWETIFGRGIVETTEDFGNQGTPPSHPELLDWLAVQFMDSGWNVKAIQRLIVTSATYRQSSVITPELKEKDPENVLLARGPRFRVEAEMVRDITLSAAGLLSSKMYGPPVMPYQPPGLWGWFPGRVLGKDEWVVSPGEDKYRRGLYTFIRRTVRYPSLTVFDAPSREVCTARRVRSDTPLQALTALNDPAFFEAAQAMAKRILREGGDPDAARATYGFRLATSRKPTATELDSLLSAYAKDREYFEHHKQEAAAVSGQSDPELAAWTMFSNVVLNLDETLTKE